MRKICHVCLTVILCLCWLAGLPAAADAAGGGETAEPFVFVFPQVTLTCGENGDLVTCTVTCGIADGERMLNGKFTVSYDPLFLELQIPVGGKKDFTELPGCAVNALQAGTVVIGFFDNGGVKGECCVARLPFKVLHPRTDGAYTVSIRADELVFDDGTSFGRDLAKEREYSAKGVIRTVGEAPMDYSLLQGAVDAAPADLSPYTEESAALYAAALEAARGVLADSGSSQETVDGAWAALTAAFGGLVLKPADKRALQAEVDGAITDPAPYSVSSFGNYRNVLAVARGVLADEKATQEETDGALDALIAAKGALAPRRILAGDADGDERITSTDARLALQLAVGKIRREEIAQPETLDVDGDGKITSTDARLILQKAVNKIEAFPVSEGSAEPDPPIPGENETPVQ